MKEEGNLYSIADEAATANESDLLEEDEDEGEDIIKSINSLLDKGKLRSDIEQTHPFSWSSLITIMNRAEQQQQWERGISSAVEVMKVLSRPPHRLVNKLAAN